MASKTTYTVFRRSDDNSVFCAVPQDRPVPIIVRAPGWSFCGLSDGYVEGAGLSAPATLASRDLHGSCSFISVWQTGEVLFRSTKFELK